MAGLEKRGKNWFYRFVNEHGRRVRRKGCADKAATLRMAAEAEALVSRIKAGYEPEGPDVQRQVSG